MTTDVADFLVSYPLTTNPDLQNIITHKKEFYDLKLKTRDEFPEKGELLKHQKIIQRLVSPYTDIDRLVLFHQMGVGKSLASIAVVENFKHYDDGKGKRALVLVGNKILVQNYYNEILKHTGEEYLPKLYRTKKGQRRIRALIRQSYEIVTIQTFLNKLEGYSKYDEAVKKFYSDRVIIIDEAQNLRKQPGEKKDLFSKTWRFLHTVERCEILLLSGTPIIDDVSEIGGFMNLILPENNQMPMQSDFNRRYFDENGGLINQTELLNFFTNRVSYVRAAQTIATITYEGQTRPWQEFIEYTKVFPTSLSEFQRKVLLKAETEVQVQEVIRGVGEERRKFIREIAAGGFRRFTRQASNFVFPDGSYGKKGYEKYVNEDTGLIEREYREEIKEGLRKYGAKMWRIIEEIKNHPTQLVFVYTEFVRGSGAILFGALLRLFQYSKANGRETTRGKRFAIITGATSTSEEFERIRVLFNSEENITGERIQVIIGSKMISQGITLKHVSQVHILTPHWNLSELDQAAARALRFDSHLGMENPHVKIYRHAAVFSDPNETNNFISDETTDIEMYSIAEGKDIKDHQVYRLMKKASIDCALNYKRNVLSLDQNQSRVCDYQECNYDCTTIAHTGESEGVFDYNIPSKDLIRGTYNLLYSDAEVLKIASQTVPLFQQQSVIPLLALFNFFPTTDPVVVMKATDYLINKRIPILDQYGIKAYLKEEGNVVFLDRSLLPTADFGGAYYIQNLYLTEKTSLKDMVVITNLRRDQQRLAQLSGVTSVDEASVILDQLSNPTKQMVLEKSLMISNDKSINETRRDRAKIFVDALRTNLLDLGEGKFAHKLSAIMRCYDPPKDDQIGGRWRDCEKGEVAKRLAPGFENCVVNSPVGFCGQITTRGKFNLAYVIDGKISSTTGKACNSYKVADINDFVQKIRDYVPDEVPDKLKNKGEKCKFLQEWLEKHNLLITL